MRASLNETPSNAPIGLPNATRSFANATDASRHAARMPTACAAIPMRPDVSVISA